mgnify:CR=1 FL=1
MMKLLLKATLSFGLFLSLGITGCNIFGTEDKPTDGRDADVLKAKLAEFLETGSTSEMTTEDLYNIAKEARAKSGMGVLALYQQISSADNKFPFEDVVQTTREENFENFVAIEQALGLILYANYWQHADGTAKLASGTVFTADGDLKDAAERVVLVGGLDACGFYTDYIAARILRTVMGFRTELEKIVPGIQLTGTGSSGYQVTFSAGTPTLAQLGQLKTEMERFRDEIGSTNADGSLLYVITFPSEEFRCDTGLSALGDDVIINITHMSAFLEEALLEFVNDYLSKQVSL